MNDTTQAQPAASSDAKTPRGFWWTRMQYDTRILVLTLICGFIGLIATAVTPMYTESGADRRADDNNTLSVILASLNEASDERAAMRDAIDALRTDMNAGFREAAEDRQAIRNEMAAGFQAAADDRQAIREEAVADREEAAAERQAIREEAAAERQAIREEAAAERQAIREEAAAERQAIRNEMATVRTAVTEEFAHLNRTFELTALCLMDLAQYQQVIAGRGIDSDLPSFHSSVCNQIRNRAANIP